MHKSNQIADLRETHDLAARALAAGARRVAINHVEWNVASRCASPYRMERYARPERDGSGYVTIVPGQTKVPFGVTLDCPCRKCDACLNRRRWEWFHRARAEMDAAARTWMATLTLAPGAHYWHLANARVREDQQGVDLERLTEGEQFRMVARSIGQEVNKWLARVRKHAQAPIRYLLVFERHKSGLPHLHGLIHEAAENAVTHKLLTCAWWAGHSKFKLCDTDPRVASYVAKYLSKALEARVRASKGYGKATAVTTGSHRPDQLPLIWPCAPDPPPLSRNPRF